MSSIRNTTDDMRDPVHQLLFLAEGLANDGNPGPAIMRAEADGQRQLVNSDRLPTRILHTEGGDEPFLALGFTFGPADPGDKLFRPATLPEGWRREGSDHSMWSYLIDEHGRQRVAIFYKAAFYDRDAFMSLETPHGYLYKVLNDGGVPVLDDTWLPAETAAAELEKMAAAREREAQEAEEFAQAGEGASRRARRGTGPPPADSDIPAMNITDPARYLGGTIVAYPYPTPPRPAPSADAALRQFLRRHTRHTHDDLDPEVAEQLRELLQLRREEHTPPEARDVD